MYDLLFFFMPNEDSRKANAYYSLMELMYVSAKQIGFSGEFFFYTHESAQLPNDLPACRIVRIAPDNVKPTDYMLLKAYAHHHYVFSDMFKNPTISVEPDQLFQRDPMEAFELPFDIGLTYPHWEKEISGDFGKINGGVTYLNNQNIKAMQSYYSAYIDIFEQIKDQVEVRYKSRPRRAFMGGGEISHLRLLPSHAFDNHRQQRRCFVVQDARVMLLESKIFNCQEGGKEGEQFVFKYYPDAIIRHFVYYRKDAMPEYAENCLGLRMEPCTESSWGTKVTVTLDAGTVAS